MSDSPTPLEILIKTLADLNGTNQVEAALKRVKESGKDVTEATRSQKDAQEQLNEVEHKGAEQANVLHENHKLIHKILHLIAHETGPAAGAALGGVAAAAGGGMMMGLFAAKQLFEWLHRMTEKAHEFKELMEGQIDLSTMVREIGAVTGEIETAREKTKLFFDDLNRSAAKSDGWKKMADLQIEQLKRVADEQKKLADVEADRDKAKLEYLKATKQITDEQYKSGLASVAAMKENRHGASDANLANASIDVLQDALAAIESDKSRTGPQLLPANKRAEEISKKIESLKKTFETMQKLMEAHREKITGDKDGKGGLQTEYNNLVGFMDNLFGESKIYEYADMSEEDLKKAWEEDQNKSLTKHSPDFWDKVKKAREILEKIKEERTAQAGAAATARSSKEQLPGAEDALKTAEAAARALEEKLKQLDADEKAIQNELSRRRAEAGAKNQYSGPIAAAQTEQHAYEAGTPGGGRDNTTVYNAQAQIAANQKIGQALAIAATQAAKDHSSSLNTILAALKQIQQQNQVLEQRVNSMGH